MDNRQSLFETIQTIACVRSASTAKWCPEPSVLERFPDNVTDAVIEHVAFCPLCRRNLQILHFGKAFTASDRSPDLERILRRLRGIARWSVIRDRIRSIAIDPFLIFPEAQLTAVRLAEPTSPAMTLTVFEINLTDLPQLSSSGLRIDRLQKDRDSNKFLLGISGFDPELAGSEVRFGLTRQNAVLAACRISSTSHEWSMTEIEHKLQKAFQRSGKPSIRLDRLIRSTAWFEGSIQPDNSGAHLHLTCPDSLSSLFFRNDVWSIMLVSKP